MKRPLLLSGLALPFLVTGAAATAQADELYLYNWTNYTSQEVLDMFEEETGIEVILDVYTSNEDLMARMQAGGATYDVVLPSDSYVERMIEQDLLYEFDATSLENFDNLMEDHQSPYFDPERAYSAPYMWGTTSIAYNTDVVDEPLDHSWREIFEPREEFQGEIGMLDEMSDVIAAAAFYLGIDHCSEDPDDWQAIQDLLMEQREHVKLYNATGTDDSMITGETLMHQMWNGAAHRAWRENDSISYLYPEEGVIFWSDNLVIPRDAQNVENAKAFINFMMSPEAAALTSNETGYMNAVSGSDAMLADDLRKSEAVNMPEEFGDRLRETPPCSRQADDLRDRVWTAVMQ